LEEEDDEEEDGDDDDEYELNKRSVSATAYGDMNCESESK
jgi:hypothetical protein